MKVLSKNGENMNLSKNLKSKLLILIISSIAIGLNILLSRPTSTDNQVEINSIEPESSLTSIIPPESTILTENVNSSNLTTATASAFSDQSVTISAPYAVLYNASTDEILYEKTIDSKIHPASLTKILTAITALNYMDSDTIITVGTELELLPKHSSLCLIKNGHRLTLYDLLTGMLVSSGNDAAYTIAVNVARLVMNRVAVNDKEALSHFIDLMNSTAKNIGCTDSKFTTPDGFDSEKQYTTLRDLIKICKYALRFKEIREIISIVKKKVVFKSGENVTWSNSNQLLHKDSLYYYPKTIGIKTGTTPLAGKCLAAAAEINGQTYIAVVADCESEDERYSNIIKLFEWVDE